MKRICLLLCLVALFISAKSQNILVLDDPCGVENTPYIEALQNLELPYQVANLGNIETLLLEESWSLVIFSEYSNDFNVSILNSLNDYLESGGKLIFSTWTLESGNDLFENMGVEIINNFATPKDIYDWSSSLLFSLPNGVSDVLTPTLDPCYTDGYFINPKNGATVIAGYEYEETTENYGAIVINAAETSIFMGQVPYVWTNEIIVPFLENQIFYLLFSNTLTWTGAESSEWFNANNWIDNHGLNAEPGEEVVCIIPSVPSGNPDVFPIINQNGASCNSIIIEEEASITINHNFDLTVYTSIRNKSNINTGEGKVILKGVNASGNITNLEIDTETACSIGGTTFIENLHIKGGNVKLNNTFLHVSQSLTGLLENISTTNKTKLSLDFSFDIPQNISNLHTLIIEGSANMNGDLSVFYEINIDGTLSVNSNLLSVGGLLNTQLITYNTSSLTIFDSKLFEEKIERVGVNFKNGTKRKNNDGSLSIDPNYITKSTFKAAPSLTIPPLTLNNFKINRNNQIEFLAGEYVFNNFEIYTGQIIGDNQTQLVINQNFNNFDSFSGVGDVLFTSDSDSELALYFYENETGGLQEPVYFTDYYYNEGGFLFVVNEALTLKSFKIFAENTGNISVGIYDEEFNETFYEEQYTITETGEQRLEIENYYLEPGIYILWWSGVSLQYDYDDDETTSFFPIIVGNNYIEILNDGWDWPYEYMSLYDWEYEIEKNGNNNFKNLINAKPEENTLNFKDIILIEESFKNISGSVAGESIDYAPEAFLVYSNSGNIMASSVEFSNNNNLTIDGEGKVYLNENKTLANVLELNNGILVLNDAELLLGPNVDIMGGAINSMVATQGTGKFSRIIPSNGEYFFPIGNIGDLNTFAPANINISNMVRALEQIISVRTADEKHPENYSEDHFLNRYWIVEDNNMASYDADIQLYYDTNDLNGLSVWMNAVSWDGVANEWIVSGTVNSESLNYTLTESEINNAYTTISKETNLVEIYVTEGVSEENFENALVILSDGENEVSSFTNEAGYASFNVVTGTYGITVSAECYEDVVVENLEISEYFSANYELFLTFYLNPVAFAGDDNTVCGNEYTLLAIDPDPLVGTWSVVSGSATIENPSSPNSLVTATAFGTVTLKWTVTEGVCEDEDLVSITFKEIPVADFDYVKNNLQVTFTNTSQNANSYTWDFGDESDTSDEVNPVHVYAQAGGYTVTLTASKEGCSDEYSELINVTYVNVVDAINSNIALYPNPTSGKIKIDFSEFSLSEQIKSVEITDISGKMIQKLEYIDLYASEIELDLSGLSANVYILKVYAGEKVLHQKIIKN